MDPIKRTQVLDVTTGTEAMPYKNIELPVLLTLIYWNTSKVIFKEGVRTDEKVALQIQVSQFMLKYSN